MTTHTLKPSERISMQTVRRWIRQDEKFAMLTCYDATMAALLWRSGVKCLLVGDTAGQFVLGHANTLPTPISFMLEITAAVRRSAPNALLMADMPFGSYHCGDDLAMKHATDFMSQAGADLVKFELDASHGPLVKRLSAAGVPVVAHLGSKPQQKAMYGRYRRIFKTQAHVDELIDEAKLMLDCGAIMILLEAVPQEVSLQVVKAITHYRGDDFVTPIIGCGAGPDCHGHVVVLHDLLGLTDWQAPFAPPMVDLASQIEQAASQWVQKVESGQYLKNDHPYHMNK